MEKMFQHTINLMMYTSLKSMNHWPDLLRHANQKSTIGSWLVCISWVMDGREVAKHEISERVTWWKKDVTAASRVLRNFPSAALTWRTHMKKHEPNKVSSKERLYCFIELTLFGQFSNATETLQTRAFQWFVVIIITTWPPIPHAEIVCDFRSSEEIAL